MSETRIVRQGEEGHRVGISKGEVVEMELDNQVKVGTDVVFVDVGSESGINVDLGGYDKAVAEIEVDREENDVDSVGLGNVNEVSRVVDDVSVGGDEHRPMAFEYFSSDGINLVVDLGELYGSEKELMMSEEEFNSNGNNFSANQTKEGVDYNMEGGNLVVDLSGADKEYKDEIPDFYNDGSRVTVCGAVEEDIHGNDYVVNKCTSVPNEPLDDDRVNGTGGDKQSDAIEIPDETCMTYLAVSGHNGMGESNNQNTVLEEQRTCARSDGKDGYKSNIVAITPKGRGEDWISEKEGEYYLADLVWGKVRGHPWWPGQIFEPSAASTKAEKHFKKGSYLVAYFGDQTFAWNEPTTLKPFHTHYVRMAKQSNLETFCEAVDCALEEVSRRVEYGLSCSCLPMDQLQKIESQTFISAGIRQESSRRYDIGKTASSFECTQLLQDLELFAADPFHDIDKLRFVTVRAQLLAFNHWKGFTHLPDIVEFDGLVDGGADNHTLGKKSPVEMHDRGEVRRKRAIQDVSSLKYKHISDVVLDDSSIMLNSDTKLVIKRGRKKGSLSSSKKSKVDKSVSSDLTLFTSQKVLSSCHQKESSSRLSKYVKVGERLRRVASGVESSDIGRGDVGDNSINAGNVSPPEEILSKLCLAAVSPMKGYVFMKSFVSFLSHYRNTICLEHKNGGNRKRSRVDQIGKKSSKLEAVKMYEFEGVEDLYWTDRIIQSNPEEQELLEPDNQLGTENPAEVDANSEDYTPTELILKFSDLESVPSITELNKIFCHYGPLDESQTFVFSKSKRAKVVFKRRSHAETAFSSAGKFRIFGHSLLGYCLKASNSSARNRKAAKSANGK